MTWKNRTVARQKKANLCPNTAPPAQSHWAWPSAQCAAAPSSPPHIACSSPPSCSQHNSISEAQSAISLLFRGHGDRNQISGQKNLGDDMTMFKSKRCCYNKTHPCRVRRRGAGKFFSLICWICSLLLQQYSQLHFLLWINMMYM